MAKLYNGGYTYPNGISVAAGKPLDDRLVLNSVEDLYINSSTRNAGTAVLNKIAYTGMPVIIANNDNPYVVLLKNSEPYENGSTTEVNASNYTTYWAIPGKSVEDYISGTIDPSINKLETEIAQHGNKLNNYADTFPQNPVASSESNGLMSTADKTKVDNYPEQFVLDLGIVESQAYGEREAAKSEVAGNRNISFIRFQVHGVHDLKTTLIMQWPNGINETAQIMCVDKQQWRRNVTGATGVVGAPTNAYNWSRTAPHTIVYDEQRRMIQLKDYENRAVSQEVELPLVTSSQDGLMNSTDKTKLDRLAIDTPWELMHMNMFTDTGEYHIHGIRTRDNDGLPIINSGGGHTIDARLTVLDSSLENGTGKDTDIVVTQILRLSNCTGGDGHIYVRTGQAATKAELTATNSTKWGTWEKLMGLFEKSMVTNIDDLNTYTTNGMYSGLFAGKTFQVLGAQKFNPGDTFLLITVNGYAASAFGTPQLTQMLYRLPAKQGSEDSLARMYMRTAYWNVNVTPKRWEFANWDRIVTASELSGGGGGSIEEYNRLNEGAGARFFNGFTELEGTLGILRPKDTYRYSVLYSTKQKQFVLHVADEADFKTVIVGTFASWSEISLPNGGSISSSTIYAQRDCLYYTYVSGEDKTYYYIDSNGEASEQSATYLLRQLVDKNTDAIAALQGNVVGPDGDNSNIVRSVNVEYYDHSVTDGPARINTRANIKFLDANNNQLFNAVLLGAGDGYPGLLSLKYKTKIDGYADTFSQNPVASSESNGLMSAADKTKLDSLAALEARVAALETRVRDLEAK